MGLLTSEVLICQIAIAGEGGIRLGGDAPVRGYIRWEREGRVGLAFATPLPEDHPWLDKAQEEGDARLRSA